MEPRELVFWQVAFNSTNIYETVATRGTKWKSTCPLSSKRFIKEEKPGIKTIIMQGRKWHMAIDRHKVVSDMMCQLCLIEGKQEKL